MYEIGAHWSCHGILDLIHHATLISHWNLVHHWYLIPLRNLLMHEEKLIHDWNLLRNLFNNNGNLLILHGNLMWISHEWRSRGQQTPTRLWYHAENGKKRAKRRTQAQEVWVILLKNQLNDHSWVSIQGISIYIHHERNG